MTSTKLRLAPTLLLGVILFREVAESAVTGQWDFESGDLRATIGKALQYLDGTNGATARETQFDTTSKFGIPGIGGRNVRVMRFPQMISPMMGYAVSHGAGPNGDGTRVNQYTVIMDLFYPQNSAGAFRALFQTDNQGDADFYVNPADGIGTQGDYAGNVTPGSWHRLAFVVDVSGRAATVSKYVNGIRAARQFLSQGRDGRWSLGPSFQLFTDPQGESRLGYLKSLQVRDRILSDAEVRLLGGPDANGIPTNDLPEHPFLETHEPADLAFEVPVTTLIRAEVSDGRVELNRSSLALLLNDRAARPDIARSGARTLVSYQPPSPLTQATNTVVLQYEAGNRNFTNTWRFVTAAQKQKPSITGQWDFDRGNLDAAIGLPLRYLDGPDGASRRAIDFNTTTAFGISDLKDAPAKVLKFAGAYGRNIGLVMPHGATPNGGPNCTRVNQWTLILDILVPNTRKEQWLALLQTDEDNTSNAELFVSFTDGLGTIGSLGDYTGDGEIAAGRWHRIAVAVDGSALTMSKYIDGLPFATQALRATELDGRYSLGSTAILFADESGDSQTVYVNTVQVRNYVMTEEEIAALGGPDKPL